MFEQEVWICKSGYVAVWPMRKRSGSPGMDRAAEPGRRLRTKWTQEVPLLGERRVTRGERWKPRCRSVELPADPRNSVFCREGSLLVASGETGASWAARGEAPEHELSDRAGHRAGLRGTGQEDLEERSSGVSRLTAASTVQLGLLGLPWAVLVPRPFLLNLGQVGVPP